MLLHAMNLVSIILLLYSILVTISLDCSFVYCAIRDLPVVGLQFRVRPRIMVLLIVIYHLYYVLPIIGISIELVMCHLYDLPC